MTKQLITLLSASAFLLLAIAEEHHDHAHGEAVEVSAAAIASMGLTTARPELRQLAALKTVYGRIELASDARTVAASPVAGRLRLKTRELAAVKPGEVLFTVESAELKALDREIEVTERRLAAFKEIGVANAELDATLKVKRESRAALVAGMEATNGVVTVRATAEATVERIDAADGAWVEVGAGVVALIDAKRVVFKASVPAADAARLTDGAVASVGGEKGAVRLGVGDGAGLVPLQVRFESDATVARRTGALSKAEIVTDATAEAVPSLPRAAVVRHGAERIVFVRDEHDECRFLAVKVATGVESGDYVEVRGLPDDDDLEVALNGVYELKLALSAKAGGAAKAGHFHADGKYHEGED